MQMFYSNVLMNIVFFLFLGENCDEPVNERRIGSSDTETSSSGTIAGMFFAILSLAALIILFLYYRKRVANLKTVIAHVQYGADPNQGKFYLLLKPLFLFFFFFNTHAFFNCIPEYMN